MTTPEDLKGAEGGRRTDGDSEGNLVDILKDIQSSLGDLKSDSASGKTQVRELWARMDALEINGSPGRRQEHGRPSPGYSQGDREFREREDRDRDFRGTGKERRDRFREDSYDDRVEGRYNNAVGTLGVPEIIDLNKASDSVLQAEYVALRDALNKFRLAGHLTVGDTGVIKGESARAKNNVLKRCASYNMTAFRFLYAIDRPTGPTSDDMQSMYLILLAQLRMIQSELGVCMVEGSGIPKEASSMFRVIRGGNQNFRDGDTLALEHACRMTEAVGRVNHPEQRNQNYRGNFRGRFGNRGFRGGDSRDFRGGGFRGNSYPPRSADYFSSQVDASANAKP
jgi:hypothetical protein